ncbi:SDR family oxidoreductase [Affinirhizobium pseudoryzae]|jgi:nucleoside-diphosphate-sugar epimerase|uniref:SDR family oxidoreductase n=1 Tax=Allorhizobium pseudoryzae TaxID=379684 RepID=UPI0013EA5485|nr:SDR family oxidoreductase [Allorhizobium pseudoryzae]
MRIFLTGATGFVGSAVAAELLRAGHQVLGLSRSKTGAEALAALGAEVFHGDLNAPDSLAQGADGCDAIIHTAFDHDFSNFAANCEKDARVIGALGAALEGSQRPFVITSVTAFGTVAPGQAAIEDHFDTHSRNPRIVSERAGRMLLERGLNVSFVRLSQIHDSRRQGLVTELIGLARRQGVSAIRGDGACRWAAAPLKDTALLYRLALEAQTPGGCYHAVAEEGVPLHAIAAAIGERLSLPVVSLAPDEAVVHFGWLSHFMESDMFALSAATQERLNWHPVGPGLLDDIRNLGEAA